MAQKIREWKERKEAMARGEAPAETEMEAEEEEPLYQKEEVCVHIVTCSNYGTYNYIYLHLWHGKGISTHNTRGRRLVFM